MGVTTIIYEFHLRSVMIIESLLLSDVFDSGRNISTTTNPPGFEVQYSS